MKAFEIMGEDRRAHEPSQRARESFEASAKEGSGQAAHQRASLEPDDDAPDADFHEDFHDAGHAVEESSAGEISEGVSGRHRFQHGWSTLSAVCLIVGVPCLLTGQLSAAFVVATLGVVAWFINVRNQLKGAHAGADDDNYFDDDENEDDVND